jgi:hypothetical protein
VTDFVGRVDRIEISYETAHYLLAVIELFARQRAQLTGQAIPARLARIQLALAACTGADGVDASSAVAVQPPATGVNASVKAVAAIDVRPSEPRRVDTRTAAEKLQLTPNGVRHLCREGLLESVKVGRTILIDEDSVENRRRQRPSRPKAR